jgi:catechol 2,3-dioxygenase-like lactoylglutathione lyase family enzyme
VIVCSGSRGNGPGSLRNVAAVRVTGFDHIVLRVADVEISLAFYCDELGLRGERVDEWRRGVVLFPSVRIDPTTVIDLLAAPRDGENPAPGAQRNLDHFCLVIEPTDLDALAGRFPGAVRADGLFGAQGFASSVYLQDPDGNTIELRSY